MLLSKHMGLFWVALHCKVVISLFVERKLRGERRAGFIKKENHAEKYLFFFHQLTNFESMW